MKKNKINSRGQITVFVIIGIVLVFSISLLVFMFPSLRFNFSGEANPQKFIKECIDDKLEETLTTISVQGGYWNLDDAGNFIEYEKENAAYLCWTSENEELCISSEPMLKQTIENQIKKAIENDLEECFVKLEKRYSSSDYSAGETNLDIDIQPERILIDIKKDVVITEKDEVQNYNDLSFYVQYPMWNFIVLSKEIIMQEVNCECGLEHCGADLIQLFKDNKNFEIDKFTTGLNEDIYKITEVKNDQNKFVFAIRNCVRLP